MTNASFEHDQLALRFTKNAVEIDGVHLTEAHHALEASEVHLRSVNETVGM